MSFETDNESGELHEGDSSASDGANEVEAKEQLDILSTLEQRWEDLAGVIKRLQSENGELQEQLTQRGESVSRLEASMAISSEQVTELTKQVAVLREEKRLIVLRIESLLARFEDLRQ